MDGRRWDEQKSNGRILDRRAFLGTVTAATVLGRQFAWAADTHKIEKVGVQLYTVRSEMKQDFEGKLAKVQRGRDAV